MKKLSKRNGRGDPDDATNHGHPGDDERQSRFDEYSLKIIRHAAASFGKSSFYDYVKRAPHGAAEDAAGAISRD